MNVVSQHSQKLDLSLWMRKNIYIGYGTRKWSIDGTKGRKEKGKGELEMVKCVTTHQERLFRGRQGNSKVGEGWEDSGEGMNKL